MENIIIFGVGHEYRKRRKHLESRYNIIALVDNNWKSLQRGGESVFPVDIIKKNIYDFILITPREYDSMFLQIESLGVPSGKIKIMVNMQELDEFEILGHPYWGQHCDDLLLSSIFAMIGLEKPTYMDLGANHPVYGNNTYFLYRQGCRGINIEANPNMLSYLKKIRPEDVNLNVGISTQKGKLPFYIFGDFSGINTFSKLESKRWNISVKEVVDVPVLKLENVVEEYCSTGFPDFLDCDIEGLDYEVLNDYDLVTNGPKVICVEVRKADIGKFDALLKIKGYFRFCRLGENNIYVKNEYSEVLCHLNL